MSAQLSHAEKLSFIHDGYIVIKQAVAEDVVNDARKLVQSYLPEHERRLLVPPELATHPDILALFRQSRAADILRSEMGPFPDVVSCQVAVTPAGDTLGGDPSPHVDGSWSGKIPASATEIEPGRGRPRDAARYFGENDDKRGDNDGQLWIDPDRRLSIGSYTALVGVALNDQLLPGCGQLGVLRGMHEPVQACFRRQRAAGGVIGPEGPDWPRIKATPGGRTYCNGLPDTIRELARERAAGAKKIEGWPWPELTPVLLARGDAVIAMHSCPHTPTPNHGREARMNVYFRIRRLRPENPHEGSRRVGHGVNDHPDRGYFGQFLEYPETYDPWQTSIEKMCDHWSEWDGLKSLAVGVDSEGG